MVLALWSLFDDTEVSGTSILTHPKPEDVMMFKAQCRNFKCRGCGCDHDKEWAEWW